MNTETWKSINFTMRFFKRVPMRRLRDIGELGRKADAVEIAYRIAQIKGKPMGINVMIGDMLTSQEYTLAMAPIGWVKEPEGASSSYAPLR